MYLIAFKLISSTNLPKEIMGFRDFAMLSVSEKSYIGSREFLSYLRLYARQFNLVGLIKFNYYVIRVRPIEDSKWEVIKSKQMKRISNRIYSSFFYSNTHHCHLNIL